MYTQLCSWDNLLLAYRRAGKGKRRCPSVAAFEYRRIFAAPFRGRVVHHALCNLIEPIFERSFIADSYANRVGKGTHRALDRCTHFARRYRYVLQCDVRRFFPSVDHGVLRTIPGPSPRASPSWALSSSPPIGG